MNQAAWIPVAVGVTATRVFAGPDIALCEVSAVTSWGTLDGTMAYSIGTNAVNIGTDNLDVIQASNRHPVLGHNMYRLQRQRRGHRRRTSTPRELGAVSVKRTARIEPDV